MTEKEIIRLITEKREDHKIFCVREVIDNKINEARFQSAKVSVLQELLCDIRDFEQWKIRWQKEDHF